MVENMDFWSIGEEIIRVSPSNSNEYLRKFKAVFGTTPAVSSIIWKKINDAESMPTNSRPIHLLFSLLFLRLYQIEIVNSILTNVTEKTFSKWAHIFVEVIAALEIVKP
jgi:hypothetical protein